VKEIKLQEMSNESISTQQKKKKGMQYKVIKTQNNKKNLID